VSLHVPSVGAVIACDKREAFAQGSVSDEAIRAFPARAFWIASLALAMTMWRQIDKQDLSPSSASAVVAL
jgi:hypothetical protein